MLEDRLYMRRPRFDSYRSATLWLIAINVVAFLVQVAASFTQFRIDDYFALSLGGLKHGYVWQLLTFQFMHGGWLHLIVNCMMLFLFGREVEEALGRASY